MHRDVLRGPFAEPGQGAQCRERPCRGRLLRALPSTRRSAGVEVAGKDGDVEEGYIRSLERGELEVQVAEDQQARGRAGSGRGQIRQFSGATPNAG